MSREVSFPSGTTEIARFISESGHRMSSITLIRGRYEIWYAYVHGITKKMTWINWRTRKYHKTPKGYCKTERSARTCARKWVDAPVPDWYKIAENSGKA